MPSDLRRKNIIAYCDHHVFFAVVILSCLGILAIYHPLQAYSPQDVGKSQLITIAVIDLEGKGISQLEASTLTDRLRTSLVQTGKVTVLERAMMEDILQETGFQQTGCVSAECAVEVGKLLGVQQIISGGIGKIGRTFTIDARIIDVETSKILKVSPRDYTGDVDGLLDVIREIAFDLVSAEPSAARPVAVPEPVSLFGVAEVVSTPSEATVYIDGIKLGLTPFTLDELKAGEHTVRMSKPGHIDFEETFSLEAGETKKLEGVLERLNILSLSSSPLGVTLYLDDEEVGSTPVRLELQTGSYRIKLKKEGYADWKEEVLVDKDLSKNITMLKMVNVWFLSEPPQAEVYLDNRYVGETPVTKNILEGTYTVRFRKDRYKDLERQVIVRDGTRVQERLELLEEFREVTAVEKKEKVVKKKRSNKLLWFGLGAVAVGGAAYYFLLQPPEEEPTGFPEPPGRP